jgi:hypothetical protein
MNKIYLLPMFCSLLFACGEETSSTKANNEDPKIEKAEAESINANILAKVNGEAITEFQLDAAMTRSLGDSVALYADQKLSQKMLQSLIVSRSMSLLAEKELDQDAMILLDEKVRSYREELLVKEFLHNNATIEPVTATQVQDYYNKNPQEFGLDLLKEFEMILSVGKLEPQDKVKLLKKLESASQQEDWSIWAKQLSEQGFPISYKKAKSKLSILKQPLKKLVTNTASGNTSELHFGDQLVIVKVISESQLEAKPLSQVSSEIRSKLAPVNMKKAVKIASDLAQQQVQIEIN